MAEVTTLDSVTSQIKTLLDTNDTLIAKDAGMTAEDVTAIQGNQAKIEELKTTRNLFLSAKNLKGANDAIREEFSQPVPGFKHPGSPELSSVIGFSPAGETHYSNKSGVNGLYLESIGPGHLSEKQYSTIRDPEYKAAWKQNIIVGWANLSNAQQKTLQEGIDDQGGFLSPEEIINQVIAKKPTPTRIAGFVSSINTSRDSIAVPKVNYSTDDLYTTGMRVTWTGEIPATATSHRVTEPVFGQLRIPVYTAMMSIPITRDLVEDSAVDLISWLTMKFGETIDLLMDNMILNGTGINQPTGILVNPGGTNQPATVVTGSASALTGDGLINLTESVPEQYDENSRLIFNKTNTGKAIRLLKDGDGRPLVTYGSQDYGLGSGRYKEVNGYPYNWSGFMPDVNANAYPIIFGDPLGYMLVRRIGFSIQVLRELYAETNQLLLLGRVRFGGMTAEEWRLRIQKVST